MNPHTLPLPDNQNRRYDLFGNMGDVIFFRNQQKYMTLGEGGQGVARLQICILS